MKTKFVKVLVSEGLPEEDGKYFTEEGLLKFKTETQDWYHAGWRYLHKPNFYLLEVPDREDEMREMLEKNIFKAKENISYCTEKKHE